MSKERPLYMAGIIKSYTILQTTSGVRAYLSGRRTSGDGAAKPAPGSDRDLCCV